MNIRTLARELADLQFETGYTFQDGSVFTEALGEERALRMLRALEKNGYVVKEEPERSAA